VGEDLQTVMRDHHRAQVALGVVPPDVADMVDGIESTGGAAKVIGAGSRTGGAGMVLALGDAEKITVIATKRNMPTINL
jgi:mevalonate kinase